MAGKKLRLLHRFNQALEGAERAGLSFLLEKLLMESVVASAYKTSVGTSRAQCMMLSPLPQSVTAVTIALGTGKIRPIIDLIRALPPYYASLL